VKRLAVLIGVVAFAGGVIAGGYLFARSQPRAFLAPGKCGSSCYSSKELAGLLASVGITHAPGLVPRVVQETDKCLAIANPIPEGRYHFVLFPKKDIKDIGDVAPDDAPYVMDCIGVIQALIREHGLRAYQVFTNGPGLQKVAYLHFHLVVK
jgi:histidine triad (HIT) family protein